MKFSNDRDEDYMHVDTDINTPTAPDVSMESPSRTNASSLDVPTAKRTAGLFLLTFKEKFNLSQRAINYAVGSINNIVDRVCESVQQSVISELKEKGFLDDIAEKFCFDDPFAELQTEYRQSQFYKSEFGLVVSSYIIVYVEP